MTNAVQHDAVLIFFITIAIVVLVMLVAKIVERYANRQH